MRSQIRTAILTAVLVVPTGCVVYRDRPTGEPVEVRRAPAAEHVEFADDAPVVEGPGVQVIEVEPPPPQRVYLYDPGYPPGCYYYNNYYWYRGYRYEHNAFVTRVVNVNVHERRYVNVTENRRVGKQVEVQQRETFQKTGGHHTPAQPVHASAPHPAPATPSHPAKKKPDQH